jgi:hypothetical protein
LVNPITITLCDCNISGGMIIVNLAANQDYILKDPAVLHYRVQIIGGHNVVWIGGEIQPATWIGSGAIKLQHVGVGGGTVHLEGINITGVLDDAIEGGEYSNLYEPSGTLADATLQVEDIRAGPLSGDSTLEHQDCIQQYGGWKNLRVDHFTCQTPYQGFFLPWEDGASNNQGVLSHFDIRNTNLYDSPASSGSSFQTLLHFGDRNGSFSATTHQQTGNLSNVYLRATQRTCDQETYPNSGTGSSDGTVVHSTIGSGGTITWASSWAIAGYVTPGVPPGGDFVPPGIAGVGYVSPGYL